MLWRHMLFRTLLHILDSLCDKGTKAKIDRLGTGDDL